jgi:hypothetical protein
MPTLPILFFTAVAILLLYRALTARSRSRRLRSLRTAWGKANPGRRRDLAAIAALHEALGGHAILAEGSADDLDLGEVFALFDRTLTEAGQQALHRLLRLPVLDAGALAERGRLLRDLNGNAQTREELQLALLPLVDAAPGTLVRLVASTEPLRLPLPALAYSLLTVVSVGSLAAWAAFGAPGFLAVIAAYVLNTAAHYSAERVVAGALPGITALQRLIAAAQRLAVARLPGFEGVQAQLRAELDEIADLSKALAGVRFPAAADDFAVYVNVFVLREVRLFSRAAPLLARHRERLLVLVDTVGTLDALQSIASLRTEQENWCEPRFTGETIEATDLRHPLLRDCVPNSLSLSAGAIITGSNMAGKSTFLRTVSVNALLAQTVFTCFARSWSGPILKIVTSLRRSDSLLAGRSYYLAEAQDILEALRSTATPPKTLCILDEIFRGTNTDERIAASAEVLRWLVAHGALVLAATHDDALTVILADTYRNLHFGERIDERGMVFDYLLGEGPAKTRNAIALLRVLGYPEDLVAAARDRCAKEPAKE